METLANKDNQPATIRGYDPDEERKTDKLNALTGLDFKVQPPLIHRDIKSMNVLLVSSEGVPWQRATAKLADFGMTKEQRTSTMSQMGTPLYMAPEVMQGE